MAPLIIQALAWASFRVAARFGGWEDAASTVGSLRFALAVMFLFTAASHFIPTTRRDFVAMVPKSLPRADLLVTFTGLLQFGGALGLLASRLAPASALCLAALLVAMIPANIVAALAHLEVAGRPAMSLWLRLPLQAFWIGCLVVVARTST